MVIKLGMIGLSKGNGHPFSFSAIINGYSDMELLNSDWQVIYDYVAKKDPSEFGFEGVRVTHVWTQDVKITEKLGKACLIPNTVSKLGDMVNQVDGVIIARDDYEKHFELTMPFLKAGKYVFVDKPLALDLKELKMFKPYLETGQLMSCSGMRYAVELDNTRKKLADYGEISLIQGIAPNSWEKYGVHLLEAIFGIIQEKPVAITALDAKHTSMSILLENGTQILINNLGKNINTFKLDFYGANKMESFEIKDNFLMFRRTLWHFIQNIKTGRSEIPAETTMNIMRLLIAGQVSLLRKKKVFLNEISI